MDTITDRELLTEGSVWIREDGKENTVLFITNTTLSPKQQKKNPPQVIYADKNGKKYNKDVALFLDERTFLNVNPTMERRSLELTVNMDDETPDGSADDGLTLMLADDEVDNSAEEPASALASFFGNNQVVEADSMVEQSPKPNLVFFPMTQHPTNLVTPESLQIAFVAYEVTPNLERGLLVHALTFECPNYEAGNNLFRSFCGTNVDHNTLFGFKVNSPIAHQDIQWTASLGAYPIIMGDNNYIKILVATNSPVPVEAPESGNSGEVEANDYAETSDAGQAEATTNALPDNLLERVEAVMAMEAQEAQTFIVNTAIPEMTTQPEPEQELKLATETMQPLGGTSL